MLKVFSFVVMILLLAAGVSSSATITAKQVLAKASLNYNVINDYIVDAQLSIDSPSIHIPKTDVKIYYKKPDKVHVDSRDGLAILPKNGLMTSNPAKQFISADELSITGSARIDGRNCYWLVMRISANPGYGPSVDVELKYIEVEGKYWLPVYTKAKLSIPLMSRRHGNIEPGAPQSSTAIIRFSNYKVNKGISDSVFIEKPERGN
jgi:hypothetical protein